MFSYEAGVSKLHMWLAGGMTLSQPGSQEEQVEKKWPHSARLRSYAEVVVRCQIDHRQVIYALRTFFEVLC